MPYQPKINVHNDNVTFSGETMETKFVYHNSTVTTSDDGKVSVQPTKEEIHFQTDLHVPKLGVMLVGLGGNNGTTFTAACLANKANLEFQTKDGPKKANYYGSVTQASSIKLGVDKDGNDFYVKFSDLLPLVNPNDFVVGGWDISGTNLYDGMNRSNVLDYDLKQKLKDQMSKLKPLKSVYYPNFIAANQEDRADNIINVDANGKVSEKGKWEHLEHIRNDIKTFKKDNGLDKVVVLWTANTERYSEVLEGVNTTKDELLEAIKQDHEEIAPSVLFATASILEGCTYINGSPQNTFVPGVMELAEEHNVYIGGDDFKSGQTKFKSVMAQYLVDAGIKPLSIASYNHLGNNDGYNLSSPAQFRSKEISKASVVDDVIESNEYLYPKGEGIDHCIVIKYLHAVGDSKVAMDEYYSELMLGGHNRISVHNVCEDSLLATPLIIDLVVMGEFLTRVKVQREGKTDWDGIHSVMSFLSYWLKAPLTRKGFKPINALNKQRMALDNFMRLLIGLEPLNELRFEERLK